MDYSNHYFFTHDLGLASALVVAGFPLDHLDKTNPQKVKFVFNRIEGQDEAVQAYWSDQLSLSVLSYFNAVKMLKNRIYSE